MGLVSVTGVDGLSRKIQDVKDFVDERVDALSRKQDSLGDSQDVMSHQLDEVQDGIQDVRHPSLPACLTYLQFSQNSATQQLRC